MNAGNIDRYRLKRVVQTGLLIALAVVVRNLSYMIYFGGAPGMRISFSGVFTKIPALLFGPVYGGIASGLLDLLGYLMKPEGPYIPWLTATAIMYGVIIGFLWRFLRGVNTNKLKRAFLLVFSVLGIVGVFNNIYTVFFPGSAWIEIINRMGKHRDIIIYGLEAVAAFGLLLLLIDALMRKFHNNPQVHGYFLKILTAVGTAGIVTTTLNTYILQTFVPGLGKLGFVVFLIPRLVQEICMAVVQAYIVAFLLTLYNRFISRDEEV